MCSNKLVKESSKVFKQAGQGVEQGVQASWSRSRARCSSKLVKESSKVFKQAGQGVEQGVQASRSRSRARRQEPQGRIPLQRRYNTQIKIGSAACKEKSI